MDKEKQIEDLTAIIDSFNIKTYENAKAVAKFIIEKYDYRKINDNEVVIRKDNYETYKQVLAEWSIMKQENFDFNKPNENEIVISKEDYDKLKHFEKRVRSGVCLTQKEWFDFCNEDSNRRTCLRIEEREQERKETAEKIYRNLIELSENPCNDREEIYKAVFEPYGVEIGEIE